MKSATAPIPTIDLRGKSDDALALMLDEALDAENGARATAIKAEQGWR